MKKVFNYLLTALFLLILVFSAYKIIDYYSEGNASKKLYQQMQQSQLSDESKAEDIPLSIDFDALKKDNGDIIAWLYCEGTPINYPVMKSKDNEDYLRHLPDKTYNRSGSIFLDCSCSDDFSDFTSIIYGHNMKNDSMFGTLVNYKEQEYYDKHPVMYLLTPDKNYVLDIASCFETSVNSDIYSKQGEEFVNEISKLSDIKTNISFDSNDKFIILSTCSYETDNSRYVVIGKLKR